MLPVAASIGPVEALMILVIVAVVWFLPGYFSARFAREKGYSAPLFFVLGVVFGLITLLVVLALPRRRGTAPPAADATFVKQP
ncbi:MAG: hypothetical protein AAGC46_19000 [Solirubrobacteraceae bacterium]